jgi:hypothetical protein
MCLDVIKLVTVESMRTFVLLTSCFIGLNTVACVPIYCLWVIKNECAQIQRLKRVGGRDATPSAWSNAARSSMEMLISLFFTLGVV